MTDDSVLRDAEEPLTVMLARFSLCVMHDIFAIAFDKNWWDFAQFDSCVTNVLVACRATWNS